MRNFTKSRTEYFDSNPCSSLRNIKNLAIDFQSFLYIWSHQIKNKIKLKDGLLFRTTTNKSQWIVQKIVDEMSRIHAIGMCVLYVR